MGLWREIRRRSRSAITPVLCAGAIGYFGYYAIHGERGLNAYTRLSAAIEHTKSILTKTIAERRQLEHRVGLLKPDGLDLDMLEEQSRLVLGLARRDEVVVFTDR